MTFSGNKKNNTERIERKIFLPLSKGYLMSQYLIKNGFKQQHESNFISSVYFDDIEYQNLRDNVDGNMYRKKLRARWYNGNLNQVRLEIKNKEALIGTKKIFLIDDIDLRFDMRQCFMGIFCSPQIFILYLIRKSRVAFILP